MGDIDFSSKSFILQNLQLANEDIHSDPSLTIESRDYISRSTCLQISFYIYLALKSFNRQPTILLFGAGHSGSVLIEYLIDCKLSHCLKLFARGDYATAHWNCRNIQTSNSVADLLGGNKADIVIMCSGMSSFASICHALVTFVSPATFFISSCFGLSRKRIYNSLKTTNIFRTFQEPLVAVLHCRSKELINISRKVDGGNSNDMTGDTDDALSTSVEIRKDVKGILKLSFEQQSADLIAKRSPKLKNMIHVLENYYALRGMNHVTARKESVANLLGKNVDEIATQEMPLQGKKQYTKIRSSQLLSPTSLAQSPLQMWIEEEQGEEEAPDVPRKKGMSVAERRKVLGPSVFDENYSRPVSAKKIITSDPSGVGISISLLLEKVALPFQQHLSKFIRVSDIPLLSDVDVRDAMTAHLDVKKNVLRTSLSASDHNDIPANVIFQPIQSTPYDMSGVTGGETGRAVISPPFELADISADSVISVTSQSSENVVNKIPCNNNQEEISESDPSSSSNTKNDVNNFPTPIESQFDANKKDLEKLRLKTKAKILRGLDLAPKMKEALGTAMHTESEIIRIFSEDSVFCDNYNLSMCGVGVGDGQTGGLGGQPSGFDNNRTAALINLLAEIDGEEAHKPTHLITVK